MKAHIQDKGQGMDEVQKLFAEKLKAASLNGFMLGGHSAMKLASERFGDDIRNATTFEDLQKHALALLAYLDEKAEGLKNVAEDKKDD